jgi:hypothetical protein
VLIARADEPGSGRVSPARLRASSDALCARTSKELPRWPLASLASAAEVLQAWPGHKTVAHTVRYTELSGDRFKSLGGADNGEILESRPVLHRGG